VHLFCRPRAHKILLLRAEERLFWFDNTVSGGPVVNMRTILYPRRYESHLSWDFSAPIVASPGQSETLFMSHDFLASVKTEKTHSFHLTWLKINSSLIHTYDFVIHYSMALLAVTWILDSNMVKFLSFSFFDQFKIWSIRKGQHVTLPFKR